MSFLGMAAGPGGKTAFAGIHLDVIVRSGSDLSLGGGRFFGGITGGGLGPAGLGSFGLLPCRTACVRCGDPGRRESRVKRDPV